eukprot:gnl/Hemi2/3091_TR1095_c0_g1_i1.p2 gnl/Hemi2/3091_TR1095_c0_g1~~gnl/Hemi2/3091_TR1095_c0_g1_i1.p2  ORF type:complete len:108 (-),score=13.29 gnl/Hemi2/3091_TR1095_c0_g1_i1:783-1106(-)
MIWENPESGALAGVLAPGFSRPTHATELHQSLRLLLCYRLAFFFLGPVCDDIRTHRFGQVRPLLNPTTSQNNRRTTGDPPNDVLSKKRFLFFLEVAKKKKNSVPNIE